MSELVGCTELQALGDRGAHGDGSGPSCWLWICYVRDLFKCMQATIGKPSSGSGMHRASRQSLLESQWHPQRLAAVGLPKGQTPPQAAGSNQDLWMLAGTRCAPAKGLYPSAGSSFVFCPRKRHVCCLSIITTFNVLALWRATIFPGAEVMGPCSRTTEPGLVCGPRGRQWHLL